MARSLNLVNIEGYDGGSLLNGISLIDMLREAVAVHGNRVHSNVNQKLCVVRKLQADGVKGRVQNRYRTVSRSYDLSLAGKNRDSFSKGFGGKYLILHLV